MKFFSLPLAMALEVLLATGLTAQTTRITGPIMQILERLGYPPVRAKFLIRYRVLWQITP